MGSETVAAPPAKKHHFVTLDAGRGLAAILVLIHHLGQDRGWAIGRQGYLAVDYFFILSGLVLARSYEPRLNSGAMSTAAFLRMRVARLYPMAAIGLLIGVAVRWISGAPLAQIELIQFLLIPTLFSTRTLFPLNMPLWSLFYELLVNVLHVAAFRRMGNLLLAALTAILAIILLGSMVKYRMFFGGAFIEDAVLALIRVCYGYGLGILIARNLHRFTIPSLPSAVPLALLCLPLLLLWWLPERLVVVMAIYGLLPIAILLGIPARSGPRWAAVERWLGAISYPLYAIHFPILGLFAAIAQIYHYDVPAFAIIATILLLAWIAEIAIDLPVRSRLSRRRSLRAGRAA